MVNISELDSSVFELLSQASDNMYLYIADLETDYSRWSKSAVEYFDLPGEYIENTAQVWASYIHPDDRNIFLESMNNIFSGDSYHHDCEYRARNRYGEYVWVRCHGAAQKKKNGSLGLFAGAMMNIGQMSKFDQITGLLSYTEFRKKLKHLLDTKHKGALLLFGIDNFRIINDLLGYSTGDKILHSIAEHLQMIPNVTFYRLGGDKYSGIATETNVEDIKLIYDKILEFIKLLPEQMKIDCKISISCGATIFPKDGDQEELLMANLEYALAKAKNNRRGSFSYYSGSSHKRTIDNFRLYEELKNSISDNYKGFSMYYQPLISKNEEVFGAEALIRFSLYDGTMVSPAQFIPVLEQNGDICEVGEWVLKAAIKQAVSWRKIKPDFHISVNVSYIQMFERRFTEVVDNILKETCFPPESLILELTESCKIADAKQLFSDFKCLSEKNICMALDDFGTGYSSIALLRELQPSLIKIDHTFVKSIHENKMDQAILECIIEWSKKAGIHVCVEGVENEKVHDFVKQFSPDLLQGYFYSKPCCADEFFDKYIRK